MGDLAERDGALPAGQPGPKEPSAGGEGKKPDGGQRIGAAVPYHVLKHTTRELANSKAKIRELEEENARLRASRGGAGTGTGVDDDDDPESATERRIQQLERDRQRSNEEVEELRRQTRAERYADAFERAITKYPHLKDERIVDILMTHVQVSTYNDDDPAENVEAVVAEFAGRFPTLPPKAEDDKAGAAKPAGGGKPDDAAARRDALAGPGGPANPPRKPDDRPDTRSPFDRERTIFSKTRAAVEARMKKFLKVSSAE